VQQQAEALVEVRLVVLAPVERQAVDHPEARVEARVEVLAAVQVVALAEAQPTQTPSHPAQTPLDLVATTTRATEASKGS
jgi:hypothetical protein